MEKKSSSRWMNAYIIAVSSTGLIIFVMALMNLPDDRLSMLVFSILAVVMQMSDVELFSNSKARVSMSSVMGITGILLFGPYAGALINAVTGLATIVTTSLYNNGGSSWLFAFRRTAFNTGMFSISTWLGGQAFLLTGGVVGHIGGLQNLLPLFVAVVVDTMVNLILLVGVINLQTGRSPLSIWSQDFRWSTPLTLGVAYVGSLILGAAYSISSLLGVLAYSLPILATSYAYRMYTDTARNAVDRLGELNDSLEKANDQLERANLDLLESLGAVIDAYDLYTYGHSRQVTTYSSALSKKLGLSEEEQAIIVKAALVHDVGKVGVSDSIIGKQGSLTDEEYSILKRHPIIGAEILSRMEGLQDLVPLIRHHHERWDGKGYPDGIRRSEIPLGARIIAVADALDAMLSDRPYRPTRSLKEAAAELERGRGKQFDPQVVQAMFALMAEKPADFFMNSAVSVEKTIRMHGLEMLGKDLKYMKRGALSESQLEHPFRAVQPAETAR